MKAKRLLTVLGDVNDAYIAELYAPNEMRTRSSGKRVWLIAAIVALMLVLVGCAVVHMLRMQDLKLTDNPYSDAYATESTEKTDTISMQGYADSPNYLAAKEWVAFKKSYDPDLKIMQSLSNEERIMPEEYWSYNCYTTEMTAKIDEICEKYGLIKQGAAAMMDFQEPFFDALQIEGVVREDAKAEIVIHPQYFYKTGTFMLSCETLLLGENVPWNYNLQYQFYCVKKTDFDDVFLNVGDMESFEQWEYNTWNGIKALLAMSPEKALVIVDKEDAFITINVMNPWVENEALGARMSREAFEAFADTFDFSFVSQPVSDADWEAARNAEQAAADAYHAQQEAWKNSDANPENQKDIADYIQHLIEYERTQDLYYGLYDLNGDGEFELLVGSGESEFGQVVVFADGSAQVTTQGFFEGMYLCRGNMIEVTDVILGWEGKYRGWFYQFDTSGKANLLDSVMMDENGFYENPWFSDPEGYTFTSPWKPISEEEYNAVRAKYSRVEVKLKPISEFSFG